MVIRRRDLLKTSCRRLKDVFVRWVPNPISVILSMDVPLIRNMYISVFLKETLSWLLLKEIEIVVELVKIKKSCGFWKMFEMEFKFSKISSMRSKCQLYTIAMHKASNVSKIRQDLPNLFFFPASLWNQKNARSSCFRLYLT